MHPRSLLLPIALLVSVPALAQDAAARAGQVEVPDFRGVAVSHGIHAEVKPGPKSVRLEGNKDELARVKLEVKDGVLTTQVEKTSTFLNKGLKDVRLYVTSPRVESVAASGGSHVDAEATGVRPSRWRPAVAPSCGSPAWIRRSSRWRPAAAPSCRSRAAPVS